MESIVTHFEAVAARNPAAPALLWPGGSLSYAELNARANQLAHLLADLGVKEETPVGVYALRSPATLTAFLAILKAGGAYVPLDPSHPAALAQFYLEDAGIRLVLAEELARFPATSEKVLFLDERLAADQPGTNLPLRTGPNSLAHILYTSGSTGKPKGVLVEHRGVVRLAQGIDEVGMRPGEIMLQYASLNFDASTFEIWAAWLNGAAVAVPPPGLGSLHELRSALHDFHVTALWLTAGLFHLVVEQDIEMLAGVRQMLTGGDVVSPSHAARFLQRYPGTTLINGYGPTENTVFAACHRIRLEESMPSRLSIGRPIQGTGVLILDEALRPVPKGERGEIVMTGEGVARGYLSQPELTAERFIHLADPAGRPVRAYRSGDLGRYQADGTLEFLGRRDDQVKINGLRIELDEIKSLLLAHPQVARAEVILSDDLGKKQIVAFVVVQPEANVEERDLRDHLARQLPANHLPALIGIRPHLPLNANGKVDRVALLREMAPAPHPSMMEHVAHPNDFIEKAILNIWCELLPAREIGLQDNFFELGGDSLAAMNMIAQVEALTGHPIGLLSLLEGGTVEAVAAAARRTGPFVPPPLMTQAQAGKAKAPFFFAHGDLTTGGLFCQTLAKKLDEERPFYAISPPGTYGEKLPANNEAVAAIYYDLIRSIQPHGPYHLGGFCNGALAIYAVAQRLLAGGESVPALVLLDPPDLFFPWLKRVMLALGQKAGWPMEKIVSELGRWTEIVYMVRYQGPAATMKTLNRILKLWWKRKKPAFLSEGRRPADLPNVTRHYVGISADYEPRPYGGDGKVLVLLRHGEVQRHQHQTHYWRKLVPQASFELVVGNHHELRASLGDIAARIREVLG